jgi:hypothetical protein
VDVWSTEDDEDEVLWNQLTKGKEKESSGDRRRRESERNKYEIRVS